MKFFDRKIIKFLIIKINKEIKKAGKYCGGANEKLVRMVSRAPPANRKSCILVNQTRGITLLIRVHPRTKKILECIPHIGVASLADKLQVKSLM